MKITWSPQRRDDALLVSKVGEVLTLNGVEFDFTQLPDGAVLPHLAIDSPWICGDVQRLEGVLHIPVLLPIASGASESARFPQPITVTQDGPLELPK